MFWHKKGFSELPELRQIKRIYKQGDKILKTTTSIQRRIWPESDYWEDLKTVCDVIEVHKDNADRLGINLEKEITQ